MNYLDLVNGCLRRLRETEVSTVTETEYSTLVGDYVNDAKHIIENAYQWAGLRYEINIATAKGTNVYSLTGLPSHGKIVDVWNETTDCAMTYKDKHWFRKRQETATSGDPMYYTYRGLDSNGDVQVEVFPPPNGVHNIEFSTVAPQARLSTEAATLKVPEMPVMHLAVAMLARERGETGGTSAAELFQIADKYLKDAIAAEAARHEEELIYYTV